MKDSKKCLICGKRIERSPRDTDYSWERRETCTYCVQTRDSLVRAYRECRFYDINILEALGNVIQNLEKKEKEKMDSLY